MRNSLKTAPWRYGVLQDFAWGYRDEALEWRENTPFEATLTITGFSRGRSSATFDLENGSGSIKGQMFLADMLDLIKRTSIDKGVVHGLWWVRKRGQSYGLALHTPMEVPSH